MKSSGKFLLATGASSRLIFAWMLVCSALVFSLAACVETPSTERAPAVQRELAGSGIVKSENDSRQYRYLQLDNGLQVLLISDPSADKAAAGLDVYVGSGADPKEREGLAHFLEHMLFLGTEKYPQPGEYQEFISSHGGSHNAYTSQEHTNYFFDVDAAHLEPALDRFAQFFIAPSLTAEYVDRERNAVNSEYAAKIKDDFRRTLDVYREVVNPEHPLAKFSVGSLATLADRENDLVREDLLAFYRRHYSAGNMALVVLGKESLETLNTLVSARFNAVPRRNTLPPPEAEPLFMEGFLPVRVFIEPEQEIRHLSFIFPVPATDIHYREKPLAYIGNLLGHEGEGSLLSLLKGQGWAEGLSAGEGLSDRHGSTFSVTIALTEAGLQHRAEIESLVFETIELIRRQGMDKWRFEELQQLGNIEFRFQEKWEPIHTVSSLADRLHTFAPADVLRGGYLYEHYDPKLIRRYLGYLTPENVLLTVSAKSVSTDRVTEKYQTPYRVEKASLALAAVEPSLVKQLHLPEKNRFIPRELDLKPVEEVAGTVPTVIRKTPQFKAWFKQDERFRVPKASIFLRVKSPAAAVSADSAALTEIFMAMVNDSLNEFTYPARLAGLQFSVNSNSRGLDVHIGGYNDSQHVLLERILAALSAPRFSPERFANIKQELLRHWRNIRKQPPYQQLMAELPAALFQPYWGKNRLVEALETKSLQDLNRFADSLFAGSQMEMLVYGNYQRREALKLADSVADALATRAGEEYTLPTARVVKLQPNGQGLYSLLNTDHRDTAVTLYIQGRSDSIEDMAHMQVLQQVLKAPFFHVLRTEKQLGYIVFVAGMPLKDVPGSALVVQSPVASAQELVQEIGGFARNYYSQNFVEDLSGEAAEQLPAMVEQQKQAVITGLTEQPRHLQEQAERYWENIVHEVPDFNRRKQLVAAVEQVTAASLAEYYRQVLLQESKHWWWVAGDFDQSGTPLTPVLEYDEFKSSQPAYIYP